MADLQDFDSLTRRNVLSAGAGLATLGIAGCVSEGGDSNPDGLTSVTSSFFMLYDLARNVAGDGLSVEDLVPVGDHGDDWEPGPEIVEEIVEADAFVYIAGFRSWSDNVVETIEEEGLNVTVVDAAAGIEYIEGEGGREEDPHFWMDPPRAEEAVENIRDGFVAADPENESIYEENASTLVERIDDVQEQYEEAMNERTKDLIVVGSHDSYQYWHNRYGFDIHSPVGISPDGEPTPQEMEEMTGLIEEYDLGYVLYDMYEPDDYARAIADETGTELLPLSPIEATTQEQLEAGMGWVEHMLEINLETLRKALEVEE